MLRIQVSNLPDGISDRKVKEFMNGAMKSSGIEDIDDWDCGDGEDGDGFHDNGDEAR